MQQELLYNQCAAFKKIKSIIHITVITGQKYTKSNNKTALLQMPYF